MVKLQKNCCGCSACAAVCPRECITMQRDGHGFYRPVINTSLCTDCGLCKSICPQISSVADSEKQIDAYGAIAKDTAVKMASSSGGVFTLLSSRVIEKGGVVFGAAFDENLNVVHTEAANIEELGLFRGSKYVQSCIDDCFVKAKAYLESNRWVYFSGTPCQIAGLKAFLKKDYATLITQDLICHSTPSPLVWEEYLRFREKEAGGKAIKASFRYKEKDLYGYKLRIEFDNGKFHIKDGSDPYMMAFINGLSSQTACFDCRFKGLNRQSDVTLADFWGVEDLFPNIDKQGGVSLIFLHTEKGKALFNSIADQTITFKVDPLLAVKKNAMALKSPEPHKAGKKFLKSIKRKGFEKAYKHAVKPSIKTRVKIILRKFFK